MTSLVRCSPDGCEFIGTEDDFAIYTAGEFALALHHRRGVSEPLPRIDVYKGGSLVELRIPRLLSAVRRGDRGIIVGFSRGSRVRLLKTVSKLRRDVIPVFLTLTYPGEYTNNDRAWKAHLKAFMKRLRRRYPSAACVWRLEFQKRGAPHFHLLLYGVPYSDLMARGVDGATWAARSWYSVVGSGDERHLRAGVRVERVRSWRGVMSYASKYFSKPDDQSRAVGRLWGVIGREFAPWAELMSVALYGADHWVMRRYLSRRSGRRRVGKCGLSVFCDASQWERLLQHHGAF